MIEISTRVTESDGNDSKSALMPRCCVEDFTSFLDVGARIEDFDGTGDPQGLNTPTKDDPARN